MIPPISSGRLEKHFPKESIWCGLCSDSTSGIRNRDPGTEKGIWDWILHPLPINMWAQMDLVDSQESLFAVAEWVEVCPPPRLTREWSGRTCRSTVKPMGVFQGQSSVSSTSNHGHAWWAASSQSAWKSISGKVCGEQGPEAFRISTKTWIQFSWQWDAGWVFE